MFWNSLETCSEPSHYWEALDKPTTELAWVLLSFCSGFAQEMLIAQPNSKHFQMKKIQQNWPFLKQVDLFSLVPSSITNQEQPASGDVRSAFWYAYGTIQRSGIHSEYQSVCRLIQLTTHFTISLFFPSLKGISYNSKTLFFILFLLCSYWKTFIFLKKKWKNFKKMRWKMQILNIMRSEAEIWTKVFLWRKNIKKDLFFLQWKLDFAGCIARVLNV